ncbi:GNAT family N-acetyltransferase [Sutcliffiella rhizosphaerae]|uniref:Ribosomal N-acetyltransferase YdaF n=1 Tax=Sutcliffiella rhizosphaerae TaxID=2880967 RepID=A0ABM8YNJ1_9BACI|nr:GNAT family protein [Sutcliffiella rhizosphaerae]CAG9621555.1 Putative ribosomal N-acetyltransferase YdaF [Sutcliffiella rhizosphaerae]
MFKVQIDSKTYIQTLEKRHAHELYQLINGSRVSIGEWLAFPTKTKHVEDSEKFIENSLKRFTNGNGYWAGIWHEGKLAGSIGFLYIDWTAKKTEIGYWLGAAAVGRGIATIAVKQFNEPAFNELNLKKIEINVASHNTKSRAIPERLGFQHEGTIRNYEYLNGEYLDREVYGMLREEWRTGNESVACNEV